MTKPIEHELSESWRYHIAEMLAQLRELTDAGLRLRGQLHILDQDTGHLRNHLSVLCAQIPRDSGLPKSTTPWKLNDAGTKLTGEIESTAQEGTS